MMLNKVQMSLASGLLAVALLAGCGRAPSGASGNVTVQSAPLAGPNAAYYRWPLLRIGLRIFDELIGEPIAHAAVSTFTAFKACNDTLIFLDANGSPITINGKTSSPVGQGLLDFSPVTQTPMSIGSLNIPAGTTVSEVDITFAAVPSVCAGASYAVEFDPGTGPIDITQNTAFKFKYASPITLGTNTQTVTLMFGTIVNAMVAQGTGLSNSTIQNINVGQAQ